MIVRMLGAQRLISALAALNCGVLFWMSPNANASFKFLTSLRTAIGSLFKSFSICLAAACTAALTAASLSGGLLAACAAVVRPRVVAFATGFSRASCRGCPWKVPRAR